MMDGKLERSMMKRLSIVAAVALLLAGCGKETALHAGLEEEQANLVMAALLDAGIDCHKTAGEEGTWNVSVAESKFADAVNLLEKAGLPRHKHQGVGEVFKKTGMISSPSEERIRFMDALAQDLAKTISMIDGVVDARVHVVLPENDPFARHTLPSSAAVAIRARWDADLTDITPSVKGLVKNAIEGLQYEKIMVTVFQDSPPKKEVNQTIKPSNQMDEDERQFLLTAVWLFMRHGRRERALSVCEAVYEADPGDGVAAVALAELLLGRGETKRAVDVLRAADVPAELAHAEAVLETRALRLSGRVAEADSRWRRYIESRKGADRKWIA